MENDVKIIQVPTLKEISAFKIRKMNFVSE